jgi:hypothetical protein
MVLAIKRAKSIDFVHLFFWLKCMLLELLLVFKGNVHYLAMEIVSASYDCILMYYPAASS